MAKPFSESQRTILLALKAGDRLHSAGGLTFLESNRLKLIQTPIKNALHRVGLIEEVAPYVYGISEAGLEKLKELQEAA